MNKEPAAYFHHLPHFPLFVQAKETLSEERRGYAAFFAVFLY
jgi:hypothetical protein